MAERSAFRYPHAIASVVQMLKLDLSLDQQRNVAEAVSLMDDRDRWLEDNLTAFGIGGGAGGAGGPPGTIITYAGPVAPEGYALCDGAAVSRTDFAALYEAIGNTWGAGDGTTTFNLPDLRGRVTVFAGAGTGLTARTVGQAGGAETHALTAAQNGPHSHTGVFGKAAGASVTPSLSAFNNTDVSDVSGTGAPHPNMQPFAVLNAIIKT